MVSLSIAPFLFMSQISALANKRYRQRNRKLLAFRDKRRRLIKRGGNPATIAWLDAKIKALPTATCQDCGEPWSMHGERSKTVCIAVRRNGTRATGQERKKPALIRGHRAGCKCIRCSAAHRPTGNAHHSPGCKCLGCLPRNEPRTPSPA